MRRVDSRSNPPLGAILITTEWLYPPVMKVDCRFAANPPYVLDETAVLLGKYGMGLLAL